MTTSNEPGYYEDSAFGIRIENIYVTLEATTNYNFINKKYCKFDVLTKVPIKTSLVNVSLLNSEEVKWLNDYNSSVRDSLKDLMQENFPDAVEYLIRETAAI